MRFRPPSEQGHIFSCYPFLDRFLFQLIRPFLQSTHVQERQTESPLCLAWAWNNQPPVRQNLFQEIIFGVVGMVVNLLLKIGSRIRHDHESPGVPFEWLSVRYHIFH